MKNWEVNRYRKDAAMHVYLHGIRQLKWGKNPSLTFGIIRNPREALRVATEEVFLRTDLFDPLVISYEHQQWLARIHTGEAHRRALEKMPKSKRHLPFVICFDGHN